MEISEKRGASSHLGRTRMRGYDLPTVIKLLEIHRGVPHHRMLRTRERDRPPGEGQCEIRLQQLDLDAFGFDKPHRIPIQGQCLAMGMSFSEKEKNLFAGHLRRDFLSSRA